MNLLDLPVEIVHLIFSYLDTPSKIRAYDILQLRGFYDPSLLKKLNISRSTFACVKTFTHDIFLNFAENIQDLNLSGITDLTVDKLRNHIQRCSNLKTLDIAFTSIYLEDLADICTEYLKNISINFFSRPNEYMYNKYRCDKYLEHKRKKTLDIFKRQQFENVHFVVFRTFDSDLPLLFMEDVPRTKILKITVAHNYRRCREIERKKKDLPTSDVEEGPLQMDEEERQEFVFRLLAPYIGSSDVEGPMQIDEDVSSDEESVVDTFFTKLFYVFRDCDFKSRLSEKLRGVSDLLDFEQIEYIFIMYEETISIYASPIFSRIFTYVRICTYLPLDFVLTGNIIFKAWNKSIIDFNDVFFETLLKELSDYFPTYICMHKSLQMKITEAPSNWYCIDSCEDFERENLPEKVTLTDFCRREGTVPRCNRTLVSDSKTLRNVTFLSLTNICLNEDFFATLFAQCKNLHTLDINIMSRDPLSTFPGSFLPLFNSLYLTKNLKNFKLISPDIEHEMIFASLCQCPTLENIHICMLAENEIDVQNIVLLIEKCHDLYSLFIEANIPSSEYNYDYSLVVLLNSLRAAAQNLQRDHLCIEVCDYSKGWNPFADVFNPSPLHIID